MWPRTRQTLWLLKTYLSCQICNQKSQFAPIQYSMLAMFEPSRLMLVLLIDIGSARCRQKMVGIRQLLTRPSFGYFSRVANHPKVGWFWCLKVDTPPGDFPVFPIEVVDGINVKCMHLEPTTLTWPKCSIFPMHWLFWSCPIYVDIVQRSHCND